MYDFDFDYETNGIELSWRDTVVSHFCRFNGIICKKSKIVN